MMKFKEPKKYTGGDDFIGGLMILTVLTIVSFAAGTVIGKGIKKISK